jgi:transposase
MQSMTVSAAFTGRVQLPERYGKWKSVHKRLTRWAKSGVWERVFAELTRDDFHQVLCAVQFRACYRA